MVLQVDVLVIWLPGEPRRTPVLFEYTEAYLFKLLLISLANVILTENREAIPHEPRSMSSESKFAGPRNEKANLAIALTFCMGGLVEIFERFYLVRRFEFCCC